MNSLKLVTLNGKSVGSFTIQGDNEVVVELDGGMSIEMLLSHAQQTGKSVGLRIFVPSEEDE